jgi:hypothetical protein
MAEHIVQFPHEAFHMCKYQDFIVKLQLEGADWRTYDATVRLCRGERAAKDCKDKNWNEVNQALYWKALQHKYDVRQQQTVRAAVRQEVPREAPVFKSAAPVFKPAGNKPVPTGTKTETKKWYSDENEEMLFGQCWAFQYGSGCQYGSQCRYSETHQCETCGMGHSTRWCPNGTQNKGTSGGKNISFVSAKPTPEHTAASSAEYQPAEYQPIQKMLTQLALPDKPFQGEERGSDTKSSSHGRTARK